MRVFFSLFFCLILALTAFANTGEKPLAENFNATTLAGKDFSLEELRGKVVVLTFWSTRCPICESEIPKFNQIADKYAGKGVVFLGLSMENETKIAEHLRKKPFKFTIVPTSLGVIMKYADRGENGSFNIAYPTMFVINQEGEIEMKTNGRNKSGALDSLIGRLLSRS
jgi:peroxiredoxin